MMAASGLARGGLLRACSRTHTAATRRGFAGAAAEEQAGGAAKLAFYGLGAGAAVALMVKGTKSIGLHDQSLGPLDAVLPLWLGGVGYYTLSNPAAALAMLPGPAQQAVLAVEHARVHRPGSLMAGFAMAAISGLWLGVTAKGYVISFKSGGTTVTVQGDAEKEITLDEVEQHNKPDDLWIAVDGKVYDMTKYHKEHPGATGPDIIIKNAGTDATQGFMKAKHSPKAMGIRDGLLIGTLQRNLKSELAKVYNCDDMQKRAEQLLTPGALAYYDAGAEDLTSRREALECWDRDWRLRPRNFIDVSDVTTETTVLGHTLKVPILAAPTALLKMGHPDGEAAVARGCEMMGVGNCLSTTASLSIEDVAAASPGCYRWFQLYVYKDHEKTKRLVQRADKEGYSAICLTVDLPVLGNRTSLKRIGFKVPKEFKMANVVGEKETKKDKEDEKASGVSLKDPGDRAAYVSKLYDQSLTLELLTWIGTLTDLPIVVKGVLRGDSAALAAAHPNCRGIIVSNHGGRQLDNCLAPLTALPDVVKRVNEVNLQRAKQGLEPVEVFVDGGIKRGRDIFKALALGAKAVLLGRPMIYGMAVGGEDGVARTVELLREELKTCMQLGGAQSVSQIDRTFIVRHGKEHDDALELEAGSIEATSWNGDLIRQGVELSAVANANKSPYLIDQSPSAPEPAAAASPAVNEEEAAAMKALEVLSAKLAKLEAQAAH
jgi:isopentenyl diphosphate isomerase/L-lactate dehydrogenase-like FMN-dependent dehydrogenase/predicted heme/steroid binding protein